MYLASQDFTNDRRVEEETQSAYIQYSQRFDTRMPINAAVGVRYEKTDVSSTALVPVPTGMLWVANNEFSLQFGPRDFTSLEGDYDYVLPSLDFDIEVLDNVKLRASSGMSIGRPGSGDIQGGQTLNQLARIDVGSGQQGNPGAEAAGVDQHRPVGRVVLRRGRTTSRSATSTRTSTTTSA